MEEKEKSAVEKHPEGSVPEIVEKEEGKAIDPQEPDWKALFEKESADHAKTAEERENYKTGLLQKKAFLKKDRDEEAEEIEEEGDLSDRVAAKVLETLAPTIVGNVLNQELAALTTNPDKQNLIRFHYDNSINKSGLDAPSVRNDLRKALAIADSSRLTIERDEAGRAAINAKKPSHMGGNNGSGNEVVKKPYGWTVDQVAEMNRVHKLATGKEWTEQELIRSWELARTGRSTAEIKRT